MIRQGLTEEVGTIFKMMKEQGIQADVATFTIVLDGSLSQLDEQSSEKQVETVMRVLSEMEAAGIEANMETYGKMMYLLLREGDRARDSVKAVLAHIWGKGLELSSHIYTILVEHYFSREPPDLDAVRDLIQSRGLVNKSGTTDLVFWERVIKGYAHAGDTASAMDIFERIDSFGAAVTLSTLEVLLRALVHFREAEQAQKLVDTVLSHRDRFMSDTTGNTDSRFWRHGFWGFAMDNGLVRESLLRDSRSNVE
ncbi:putative glutathione s-transferase protein [Phaeoacremonium minimum UCRPA7]|uniref:Putative glutathione s-transferase protein n=1 Tax=Phaeoacremonium minimum (strain UCR-PA7) TaxID=1286976 RepID=R8BSC0_PHAM7|nr:putative glutathione s-transferase protein [Phaeoacremonium minimum UCRPA7]EOO02224.1 putative glutathione s-transferase protein [Phaeoacremonium minimum UCRPA7]